MKNLMIFLLLASIAAAVVGCGDPSAANATDGKGNVEKNGEGRGSRTTRDSEN